MIQAASLDLLEKAMMPSDQARAIVQAVGIELDARCKDLASKSDLDALRRDVEALRLETKANIEAFRAATKSDIDALRVETKSDIEASRLATKTDLIELRSQLTTDFHKALYEVAISLESKIHAQRAEMVKWVFTVAMGQMALTLGGVYFIIDRLVQ